MSRSYQEIGLTEKAEQFLRDNIVMENHTCPHCEKPITQKPVILATKHIDSFCGSGPYLMAFRLKDGRIVREVVQTEPWSSGPMAFLTLQIVSVEPENMEDIYKDNIAVSSMPELDWIEDESAAEKQYDKATGKYWV